jgi:2-keto-4-pentenoate hydratase
MLNQGKCKFISMAAMTLLVAGGWAADTDEAEWIDAFAAELHRAWQAGEPMPQLSGVHPEATLEDGYRVQERLVERMFGPDGIGGFKAAGISQNARDRNNIDGPLTGVIPASGVLDADDSIVVDLSADSNRHVETEIGYVFSTPISNPDISPARDL